MIRLDRREVSAKNEYEVGSEDPTLREGSGCEQPEGPGDTTVTRPMGAFDFLRRFYSSEAAIGRRRSGKGR